MANTIRAQRQSPTTAAAQASPKRVQHTVRLHQYGCWWDLALSTPCQIRHRNCASMQERPWPRLGAFVRPARRAGTRRRFFVPPVRVHQKLW